MARNGNPPRHLAARCQLRSPRHRRESRAGDAPGDSPPRPPRAPLAREPRSPESWSAKSAEISARQDITLERSTHQCRRTVRGAAARRHRLTKKESVGGCGEIMILGPRSSGPVRKVRLRGRLARRRAASSGSGRQLRRCATGGKQNHRREGHYGLQSVLWHIHLSCCSLPRANLARRLNIGSARKPRPDAYITIA